MPVRRVLCFTVAFAVLIVLQGTPVFAAFGIASTLGATELPGAPAPNVYPGSNEGALPVIFPEVLGATVLPTILHPLGLDVDHNGSSVVASPTISGNIVNPALVSATIPVGTLFNSYMLHFDPVGAPFFSFYISTITFDNPIIGVQLFSDGFALQKPSLTPYTGTLEQGDLQVFLNGGPGPPVVYYPSGVDFRGVEEDAFVLAIAGNTVMVAGSAHGAEIDQIRVLTVGTVTHGGVPEPASVLSWAIISLIASAGVFVSRRIDISRVLHLTS